MPNFETGHYFLTMLAPVRGGSGPGPLGSSHRQQLLTALASLPNSEVTANSRGIAAGSPFARNCMTHLARFVLIDDQPYNGRETGDALVAELLRINPLVHQPVDRLSMPYLLFAAEFDAGDGSDASLRRFTDALWATMRPELTAVFSHCHGFEAVQSAETFFTYVKACQIETTMPFNDYYPWEPAELAERLRTLRPDLPLPVTGAKVLAGITAAWLTAILAAALLPDGAAARVCAGLAHWGLLVVPLLGIGAVAYLALLYRRIMTEGLKPLPRSASLPEVLKAIYLQQHFTDFVIRHQGAAPEALLAGFLAFAESHRPDDTAGPTQEPGLIRLPDRALPKGAPA